LSFLFNFRESQLIINGTKSSFAPIGVFDSGVGGLTVLRALREHLPYEDFIYLGDTARLPYGTKSAESIVRYSLLAASRLVRYNIKCLVVACNTASAVAIDTLRVQLAPLPVIGVVDPGADAGIVASASGRIAIIATESTVRGGAYQRAILSRRADARPVARACPLFVALAEEGWTTGPIVSAIAHRYLDDLFALPERPDTLVLGCTHFPVLLDVLCEVIGDKVTIVDSARTAAKALSNTLEGTALARIENPSPTLRLLATDGIERFSRVGGGFLGQAIDASDVELVDLSESAE
jgi:glutamate racemase